MTILILMGLFGEFAGGFNIDISLSKLLLLS
jgi:hypothetical protein